MARGGETEGDSLPEKLIKYVPAETLAFFVPAAALIGDDSDGLLIAAVVLSMIGTVGYLWNSARPLPPEQRPRPHFYVLAVIAFVAWAATTSGAFANLLDLDEKATSFILLAAVFMIPLVDSMLNSATQPKPEPAT